MPGHGIVVIGASAGGVEALVELVRGLPADLAAALFVVLHVPEDTTSILPDILSRAGQLKAAHFADGTAIEPGRIYVAPPGRHLLVRRGFIELQRGPKVHGHRPAVDPTFRSAAQAYGPQVISVVLSGTLSDGAAGTLAVKLKGGIAIVQDPLDALYGGMPENTIASAPIDHVVPLVEIPALLERLVHQEVAFGGELVVEDLEDEEEALVAHDLRAQGDGERVDQPSVLTCPDCGGVLWEMADGQLIEYRCHVGHVYGIDSLIEEQAQTIESALWTAIRSLAERAVLSRRLATRATEANRVLAAQQFEEQARQAASAAAVLRQIAENGKEQTP